MKCSLPPPTVTSLPPPDPSSSPSVADAPSTSTRARLPVALDRLGAPQLISLLAFSMALTALGIDLLLPAFGAIRAEFGLAADDNATAGLVTAYFLGLAGGQLVYGVLSDALGRRRTLYLGYAIYFLGAVASFVAPSLAALYAARALWGLGAAGSRVVTLAVIRDTWVGDRMSRAMSFVMAVFITVPILAPALGQLLVDVAPWRWIFAACALGVVLVATWARRLPETLPVEDRLPLQFDRLVAATKAVLREPRTMWPALAMTSLYGVFTSWIASSELIISDVFGRGEQFPLIFGGLAAALGVAMLVNARIVEAMGTKRVTRLATGGYVVASVVFAALAVTSGGVPGFWPFVLVLAVLLGSHALLVPNINSLAMEHVGHVAGTASSVIGALQIAGGALLGSVLDRTLDGSVTPLALGFLGYGVLCWLLLAGSGVLREDG